jgi:pimeloyl-ACP methyl ester carboxylesterase
VYRALAFACHATVLLAAWFGSHSLAGFLLKGPGLGLLLDRYLLRLLGWSRPVRWKAELAACLGCFLLGALGFYLSRPGIVPLSEALYRGALVCVILFVIGSATHCLSPSRLGGRLALWTIAIGLLIFLAPVAAGLHPIHTTPKRTPASQGFDFEDVRFRAADGARLAGWLVPHPRARGNVIFCHGHGRNRGHVAALLGTLHDLELNVLAFDFRGHGESEGHTSTFGAREVGDLVAAAGYLRVRFPDKPLFLVGVSLGAAVSLQALPALPDVAGVWSEGAFSRLDAVIDNEFALVPSALRKPLLHIYHRIGYFDCGFQVESINPIDTVRGATVPICFCQAQRDTLVPPEQGRDLFAACTGPKTCWWVANASHYNVRQRNHQEPS